MSCATCETPGNNNHGLFCSGCARSYHISYYTEAAREEMLRKGDPCKFLASVALAKGKKQLSTFTEDSIRFLFAEHTKGLQSDIADLRRDMTAQNDVKQDITEIKKCLENLLKKQRKFQSVPNLSTEILQLVNFPTGKIIEIQELKRIPSNIEVKLEENVEKVADTKTMKQKLRRATDIASELTRDEIRYLYRLPKF
ncbi:hypothetical protein GE061_010311 [Apolygus lucorum]|uniref:Uncharacterized protein n=1 Tax=Apolygus lucorum TaxID=248454 RepID=A0A8S9Y6U4_APOLU|nr:hypothetical protein GE061_010311 [Apolygus lucorum]